MTHVRAIGGTIDYLEADGSVRGEERFLIVRTESSIRLDAEVEIHDLGVTRSVAYEADPDFTPRHCFVSVSKGGHAFTPAFFTFADGSASMIRCGSPPTIETAIVGDLPFFGAHPIAMDGWLSARALRRLGGSTGDLAMTGGYTSSLELDGASEPGLHRVDIRAVACGLETVHSPAGSFTCQRIDMRFGTEFRIEPPPYTLWITDDDEQVLVRAEHPTTKRAYLLRSLVDMG